MKQGEIARLLGMTQPWLSQVEQTPLYRAYLEKRRRELVDELLPMPLRERIAAILLMHGLIEPAADAVGVDRTSTTSTTPVVQVTQATPWRSDRQGTACPGEPLHGDALLAQLRALRAARDKSATQPGVS